MSGLVEQFSWTGAGLGLLLGVGGWLVLVRLPRFRRPTLEDRLEPYLRDTVPPSALLTAPAASYTPFPVVERLVGPALGDAARAVERALGGGSSVRRRLERAGRAPDVEAFRARQLVWGVVAAAGSCVLAGALWARGALGALPAGFLVLSAAGAGVLAADQDLSRRARRRDELILAEFPTIAELLALAVSAGEGPVGALERVCRLSHGELAVELRRCLADARAGASLPSALHGLGERTALPSLTRFVDGVIVAVERGTPLGDVLRAQAGDVREASRRALMESGGRKEVAMMVPVVFLVLPITVLFAVFPGVAYLSFQI